MAVVRANYCKRGASARNIAKANISYIQTRPGRDKERLTRTLFGPAGNMGRAEAYQFITDAPEGTYFYRLKLSPDPMLEDGKRDLNMHKLTRAIMKRLEKRLKTAIPWAAALHDDHTDIRHVHILAAIPRRLNMYELEFLIREATALSQAQRRFLDLSADRQDRGVSRLPWQQPESQPMLKTGKYTAQPSLTHYQKSSPQSPVPRWGRPPKLAHPSCTCPRCLMPQSHIGHRGSHQCPACGLMLHKKKALSLKRALEQGRGLERAQ
jgi:hypothetical protein